MITTLGSNLSRLCLKYSSKSNVIFDLALRLHHRFSTSLQLEASSVANPTVYEFLVNKHHFSPESASHIASVLTRLKNPERAESILSFFKENGFSTSQLEKMVKCNPRLLAADLDKGIKPKFKILHDLRLSRSEVAEMVEKDSTILTRSLNNRVIPNLSLLKNLLGSDDELARFLKLSRYSLRLNLDNTLVPNIGFFNKCGIPMDQILSMMHHFPTFMLGKHVDMKQSVARADAMGVSRSSKLFMYAVRVIDSMSDETWELKLRTFREVGFSDNDIATMFRKQPMVFGLSRERIKKTTEVLLANGKYKLSNIVSNPTSLMRSIEKRYKPRMRVLELLEDKKLIQRWPGVSSLGCMTDEKFFEKYVAPFRDENGDKD